MSQGLRYAGALTLAVLAPLSLTTGCPFSAETYHLLCNSPADCDDGNPCTVDACNLPDGGPVVDGGTQGVCEHPNEPAGASCKSKQVCNGEGACVMCMSNSDCATNVPELPICNVPSHTCVSCSDGKKNGQEEDVDCGGPDCGACQGKPCDAVRGCGHGALCAMPESICCATPCDKKCEACAFDKTGQPNGTCTPIQETEDPDGECTSLGGCGAAPNTCRCSDGLKNGQESDVDCGGPTCPKCSGGKACGSDADCASDVPTCVNGACCSSLCEATCTACNSVGQCVLLPAGSPDPTCPVNTACGQLGVTCMGRAGFACGTANGKCLSGVCSGGTCAKGASGKPCSTGADCTSGTCQGYLCT